MLTINRIEQILIERIEKAKKAGTPFISDAVVTALWTTLFELRETDDEYQ